MRNHILAGSFAGLMQSMKDKASEDTLKSQSSAFMQHVQREIYAPLVAATANHATVQFEDIDFGDDNLKVGGSKKNPKLTVIAPVRHALKTSNLDDAVKAVIDSADIQGIDDVKVASGTKKGEKDDDWSHSNVELLINAAVFHDGTDDPDEEKDMTNKVDPAAPPANPSNAPDPMVERANAPHRMITKDGTVVETEPAGKILPNPEGTSEVPAGIAASPSVGGAAMQAPVDRGTESANRSISDANPNLPGGKGAAQKALEQSEEDEKSKKDNKDKDKGGKK